MSRVFVAHDRTLGRVVAIKVFSPEVAAEVKTDRFRLEIQLAAKLQHPHIVPLLFAGENRGVLYFTMPYIDGESLRARIARDGPLPLNDAIRTLRHLASAIAYAHKQGVVHRDIKPDNVLLAGEFALVTDFGVAKALSASTTADGAQQLTSSGMAIGTPAYMAPEQALADPSIDHRADIYAFGIVAYEVLTGTPPFSAKTAQATLAAHITKAPEAVASKRADIPEPLAALIMRCLEKRPEDRPQSATEILGVLDSLSTGSITGGEAPVMRQMPKAGASRKRGVIAGVATAVLVAAIWFGLSSRPEKVSAGSSTLNSIAVLPLDNVGGDQKDEYFSDGMTDELANALAKLPGLRVASRTSAYSFKGRGSDVDFAEIGRKLNVQAVIEGSVRRAGNRLRINAQLVSVADGLTLWSDSYDRAADDVFQVQDEIAKSIAAAVSPRLGTQASAISADSRGTENLAAFDSYLRGRHLWNARGADNLRRAISYFDSAIAKDPGFARAHAARAVTYALLPEYTDAAPKNASEIAYSSADRALALEPNLAEAYVAIGLASLHDWKYAEAEAAYRKAIQLEPRNATAHQWYGELLYHTGRLDASLAEIRKSGEIDPLATVHPAALGYALYLAGEYEAAIREVGRGIEVAPTLGLHRLLLGNTYAMMGRHREALEALRTAVRLDPEIASRQGYLAYALAKSGQVAESRAILSRLNARPAGDRPSPMSLAIIYLGLGENDKALAAIEQAVNAHDISLFTSASPLRDPIYDPVRSDPRFQRVIERMNLAPFVTRK
jgi:serine/threonine protein kinase/tetratricopeptide (TPR) repeat protein